MSLVESLSDEQREVLKANGKFVLRACPGSGKTFTVTAKLEDLLNSWSSNYQGIAALSFTNVAWKEIQKNLIDNDISFRFPHFIGTLDSFINRHIFLPFGHLVMGCVNRPELVGEPYGSWSYPILGKGYLAYFQYFDLFSLDIHDCLINIGDTTSCFFGSKWEQVGHTNNILKAKNELFKKGFATQSDANFFALKILENYPEIAQSLVSRFPYFIIDEAQDTTEIQMAIIDKLVENGLEEIILVGDPDQSIYEWNFAKPDLFIQKYEDWDSAILNDNRRSSQTICNHTYYLSSLDTCSTSVACQPEIKPEIIIFDKNAVNDTIDYFIETCTNNGIEINEQNVAVIFRSNSFIDLIKGTTSVGFGVNTNVWATGDYWTKDIVRGKYLYDNGDYITGFKTVKYGLIKFLSKSKSVTKEVIESLLEDIDMDLLRFRTEVYKFIDSLPDTRNISIRDFITAINENNEGFNLALKEATSLTVCELFRDITTQEHKNCRIGTIHSVKGETFEATLLLLKTGVSTHYTTMIKEGNYHLVEEMRNVYVAITRPRQLLVIAVPNEKHKIAWERVLNIEESE
ncbi:MAG: ATP-dependent helicase [Arcobacteraceae bacterium]|nr:ATP-dependent helicase [Arcobacteraceae bacterium]